MLAGKKNAVINDINLKTNTMRELTALIEKKNDGKKKALKVEFING